MKSQEGSKPAERLNGSEILVRALAEEGVEYVFGYPGGSVLNIFDAIYKQDKFKHILVRHEQGAAHAADAYSRASNKVGVALVTSGPGATNAVTGIATAYADSIPMVIFTGQVNTLAIGQDAFQEVDIVGISRPCLDRHSEGCFRSDLRISISGKHGTSFLQTFDEGPFGPDQKGTAINSLG